MSREFRKHRWSLLVVAATAANALLCGGILRAMAQDLDEDKSVKVKTAYLFNFCKFVTWPTDAFADDQSPIVLGLVGGDPFGGVLEQTVKDKTVAGRKLEVRHLSWSPKGDIAPLKKCHLLYLNKSLGEATNELIFALDHASILVVGEDELIVAAGGMVGFVVEGSRIVFWVNQKAAELARLQLSSQLLKLARPFPGPGGAQASKTGDSSADDRKKDRPER